DAILARQANGGLAVSLSAHAPEDADARLDLRVQLADPQPLVRGRLPQDWQAWLNLGPIHPDAWRAWVAVPLSLQPGAPLAPAWVQMQDGRPDLTLWLTADAVHGSTEAGMSLALPRAELWAAGAVDQWQALLQDAPLPEGLQFQ